MLSKKGSSLDLFYIVIGFLGVAIVGILISHVVTRFNTELQLIDTTQMPTEAKGASTQLAGIFPSTLNGALLFLFFGACIVALILASLTAFHPIFFIMFLFEWLILVWISGGIANSFQSFIETAALATEYTQYGTIIFIFHYLPFIIGAVGMLLAAIMYKVGQNNAQ